MPSCSSEREHTHTEPFQVGPFDFDDFFKFFPGGDKDKNPEGFVNNLQLNQTCMVLIVVYALLFMYKKEVMAMVNKFLK
tara:strand:+ start:374 stop:610 length:237 start_codon:yes stop_codon:yes gene_type:complete